MSKDQFLLNQYLNPQIAQLANVTPNIQVEEILKLAKRIGAARDNPDMLGAAFILDSIRLADLWLELHLFMSQGNALPQQYQKAAYAYVTGMI